jgi:hypothetical protein
MASFMGLRYLVSTQEIDDPRLLPLRRGQVTLYRNLEARPLATLVGCGRVVDSAEAAWALLPELRPAREVVLEPRGSIPADLTRCQQTGTPGTVEILDRSGDSWELQASLERPGLLVLAESDYPGWQATVDGDPTPIHVANLAFRAISLPAGEHSVRFEYRPGWLRPSLLLAGLSLVLGLLALLLPPRGRLSPS